MKVDKLIRLNFPINRRIEWARKFYISPKLLVQEAEDISDDFVVIAGPPIWHWLLERRLEHFSVVLLMILLGYRKAVGCHSEYRT